MIISTRGKRRLSNKLNLDHQQIARCRQNAVKIAGGIQEQIELNTTLAVERTVLRLIGIDGTDRQEIPLANIMADQVNKAGKLDRGILYWLVNAILTTGKTPGEIALMVESGELSLADLPENNREDIELTGW